MLEDKKIEASESVIPGLQDVKVDFDDALERGRKAIAEDLKATETGPIGKNTTHDAKVDEAIAAREEAKTPAELYNEVRAGLIEPVKDDKPVAEVRLVKVPVEMEVKAEDVQKFEKDLTDEQADNVAVRNVDNVSDTKGVNRPVIAGPGGRRVRTKPAPSTQPVKSVLGKRSGLHVIHEDEPTNDNTRVTMNKGVHKPGQKGVGTSIHGRRTGVYKIKE